MRAGRIAGTAYAAYTRWRTAGEDECEVKDISSSVIALFAGGLNKSAVNVCFSTICILDA